MSEDQLNEKTAGTSEPPHAQDPAQQDADRRTIKSYDELMHGFEEIRKIVDNQDKFDKQKNTDTSCNEILKNFDKIKKIIDNQETPED